MSSTASHAHTHLTGSPGTEGVQSLAARGSRVAKARAGPAEALCHCLSLTLVAIRSSVSPRSPLQPKFMSATNSAHVLGVSRLSRCCGMCWSPKAVVSWRGGSGVLRRSGLHVPEADPPDLTRSYRLRPSIVSLCIGARCFWRSRSHHLPPFRIHARMFMRTQFPDEAHTIPLSCSTNQRA